MDANLAADWWWTNYQIKLFTISQLLNLHPCCRIQKKLQACKTAKILTAFQILRKKKPINIFNHVNTDWLIISLLNTVIEKKIEACENRMWRQTSGWVTCAKPSRRNTGPSVSHTFSRRFSKQNYPKYISDVVSKRKTQIIRCFVWICKLP